MSVEARTSLVDLLRALIQVLDQDEAPTVRDVAVRIERASAWLAAVQRSMGLREEKLLAGEIRKQLRGGMGSFGDIVLCPSRACALTSPQLNGAFQNAIEGVYCIALDMESS